MAEAENDLRAALLAHGYVADSEMATALYLAEALEKPILIEGEAGVGKTEVAHVLAKLRATELIRLQCYEGLDYNAALYEWNYQKQILNLRLHEVRGDAQIALADLYSEDYLSYRPISRALLANERVVLLIDEVDRADEEFEALLLETLAEYQISIPEFGTLRAKHTPYVILTSNRTRELSDALRRRCLYLWIDYPPYEKELEVLRLKVPGLGMTLAARAAAFVQALRRETLNKRPGLAEAIDWTRALLTLGANTLDRAAIEQTLGCLLKDHHDIVRCRRELIGPLLEQIAHGASV